MAKKKKYLDQSRFPKVVTNGYEKEFATNYDLMLKDTLEVLGKKMLNFIKN